MCEKERRIRVLTSVVQKRFKFPENTYICSPLLGHGPSMLPTLNLTGDWILSEKVLNLSGKVHNGDIVTARSPENPKKFVVKRIMGMEGDTVTYIVDPKNSEKCRTITVPKGHVWIQEDNIYSSNDSRRFGSIPYGLIEGKVFFRESFVLVCSFIYTCIEGHTDIARLVMLPVSHTDISAHQEAIAGMLHVIVSKWKKKSDKNWDVQLQTRLFTK
ncbi:hypothetical protein C5167_026032 [Papaver somniferum]|nr:hypothetical protein C5167_026032 [Papaver somniferum]